MRTATLTYILTAALTGLKIVINIGVILFAIWFVLSVVINMFDGVKERFNKFFEAHKILNIILITYSSISFFIYVIILRMR